MSAFLPYLLNWLQEYGYPALWGLVFVGAAGIPLPITLVLLAAGAFAALGDYNLGLLALIALSAAVGGDSVGYLLGRRFGGRLLNWLEQSQHGLISPQAISRSRVLFHKRGGLAIFLGRTVFSAIGVPITLLSGAEGYPYGKFLFFDGIGELVGVVMPLGLGFIFGASWEAVGDILGMISLLLMALGGAVWISYRLLVLLRRLRETRAQQQAAVLSRLQAHESGGSTALPRPSPASSPGSASGPTGPLPL